MWNVKYKPNNDSQPWMNIPRFSRQKSLTKTECVNAKVYKTQEDEPIQQ